ncbi:hypothetical protein ACFL50_03095 [Candidatus Latescibacterota bacterium]
MIKVFFGGSRKINKLNNAIKDRTDKIISHKYHILIGDANGADKAMQQYLIDNNYENVTIYCMEDTCRNNIGGWKTKNIHSDRKNKDYKYYSIKDLQMSEDADYGFMLWDGKSKGTLNNIFNLCERNKNVLVYFTPTRSFHTLKNFKDVSDLLNKCDKDALKKFDNALNLSSRLKQLQQQKIDFDQPTLPI